MNTINQKIKELEKEIEKLSICPYCKSKLRNFKCFHKDKIDEEIPTEYMVDRDLFEIPKAKLQTLNFAKSEFIKMIDDMDIDLLLTDVVNIETGNKVEIPNEIKDLWDIYWKHIQQEIKSQLEETT